MTIFRDFIDIHTHGIGEYDTRTGSPENILQMAALHVSQGTGAILPAIYPDSIDEMRKNMEAVRRAIEIQKKSEIRSQKSEIRDWTWRCRHCGNYILHQHVEPFGDGGRGTLGQESSRARA